MVFLSHRVERTPAVRVLRIAAGFAATAAIVFTLRLLPYDVLREERLRLYGETHTTGLVTEVGADAAQTGQKRFFIHYTYVDQDGFARQAIAPLPKDIWKKFRPGHRVAVFYANPKPGLSRVPGEIEPAFQLWLRDLLN